MFKQFTTIINTGAAVMWFAKIQNYGPADVKEILFPIIPTAEAMVAMLNHEVQLDGKPHRALNKKRPPAGQHSNAATTRLAQVTATHFIGPVQPPRRLTLPRPAPQALHSPPAPRLTFFWMFITCVSRRDTSARNCQAPGWTTRSSTRT